jgi:hypothetical protein
MSNKEKKNDNDNFRSIQSTLNNLNKIIKDERDLVDQIPEISALEKYQTELNSNIAVVDDEDYTKLIENVAALQFAGKKRDEICKALDISHKKFKEIVCSEEYLELKKLLLDDQKSYIMSQVLKKVDSALKNLDELINTADEDKTKLNAIALVLEQAQKLIEDQKLSSVNANTMLSQIAQNAAKNGNNVSITLAELIINQRKDRGLN